MIDENEEECRQAIVSKDTEGMEPQEGWQGIVHVLAGAMPPGPRYPYEQEVLGDEARGAGRAQVEVTWASTSAFQQGSLETHLDHHTHP